MGMLRFRFALLFPISKTYFICSDKFVKMVSSKCFVNGFLDLGVPANI